MTRVAADSPLGESSSRLTTTVQGALTLESMHEELRFALKTTVLNLLGPNALSTLYKHLEDRYDIIPEEIPIRLVTLFDVLADKFGVAAARTIAKTVARQLYSNLDLYFSDADRYELRNYFEQAKEAVVHK